MVGWRYEIALLVLKKYFTCSLHSLVKYFSTLKEKFRISAWPCNILYQYFTNHSVLNVIKLPLRQEIRLLVRELHLPSHNDEYQHPSAAPQCEEVQQIFWNIQALVKLCLTPEVLLTPHQVCLDLHPSVIGEECGSLWVELCTPAYYQAYRIKMYISVLLAVNWRTAGKSSWWKLVNC